MGAENFFISKVGQYRNVNEAFSEAVKEAQYSYGHDGYTGTIAEKKSCEKVEVPKGKDPYEFAKECFEGDGWWDSKWGPAAYVEVTGKYLQKRRGEQWKGKKNFKVFYFFGWASS